MRSKITQFLNQYLYILMMVALMCYFVWSVVRTHSLEGFADTDSDARVCLESCHALGCGAHIEASGPLQTKGCVCVCEGPVLDGLE